MIKPAMKICPSASVYNTLLDLQNSSNPTQPHSIIAKYQVLITLSVTQTHLCCR